MKVLQEETAPPQSLENSPPLTCQLSQDLFDGHTTSEGVSVSSVGSDQVISRCDGGFNACCASFLQNKVEKALTGFYCNEPIQKALKFDSKLRDNFIILIVV